MKARTSALASSISGPILGNRAASWSRTSSQAPATASASGWAKIVRNTAATMSAWALGTWASRLRAKWTRQRWCAAPWKERLQRLDQAGVLVGDDQPHPGQAALLRRGQEAAPEHLVLAVADVEAEDLPGAVGGDPGGDHDGHRHDLADVLAVAHVQVGRVEVDVGELDVVQRPGAERADDLVQAGADPRDLGLGDPGVDAQRLDQVVDAAGRDAVDVGLHHHRVQRLVDPAAGLEDRREERALAQLGDPQLDVAGLGGQQPRPGARCVR